MDSRHPTDQGIVSLGFRIYIGEIHPVRAIVAGRAIPCSDCAQQRHDIIPNRVALVAEESASAVTGAIAPAQSGGPTHAHLQQDEVIAMLQQPARATADDVASASGWQR